MYSTSDRHLFPPWAKSIQPKSLPPQIYFFQTYSNITLNLSLDRPDSSVGIATRYGLEGPGVEFQ